MKAKSLQLKEKRAAIVEAMEATYNLAASEQRDLNKEELTTWKTQDENVKNIDEQINVAETMEARAAKLAGAAKASEFSKKENRRLDEFSFVKVFRAQMNGKTLDGFEAEMIQEGEKEARNNGKSVEGLAIPNLILNHRSHLNYNKRTTLTAATAATAGNLIQDGALTFIDALRAQMKVAQMGAQFLSGLQGDLPFIVKDGVSAAAWAAENGTAAESNFTTTKKTLSPKRLAAFTPYSKRLLNQSSLDVEALVRQDLMMAIAQAVDIAAINGSGSNNQPTGILNTTGIGSVAGGTNGAAPTLANIVQLEQAVAVANADVGSLGYLTNPKVRGKLKSSPLDAGSGRFLWDYSMPMELNGYNAQVSTNVPSDLTKGTGTALSAVIFGNFNDLVIGQFGSGLDLLVDPYTSAKDNIVNVIANSEYDCLIKQPASFAAMVDAITV